MPKLLIFAPCDKVIIDQENNISLISVLQELQVPVQGPFPPNAQAGIRWNVLALWLADDSDGSGQYYERCVLLAPDGTKKIEVHDEFVMERRYHRSNLTIFGFPIDQAGDYILTLELRQNEAEFTEVARFPITLSHIKSASIAPS